ncbi:MAG TPA: hypothetical protein PKI99_04240 [Terrimesophilobacter sp.]|nr:hypothetical protein [Terrimesophilobacter sp.]HNP15648.1 hypothetical protein [Terrimesophilobacter sp.]
MSRDIEDAFTGWWGRFSLSLVVDVGVEVEFAEEVSGGFVDDANVLVVDEDADFGSFVGSTDADVVQF